MGMRILAVSTYAFSRLFYDGVDWHFTFSISTDISHAAAMRLPAYTRDAFLYIIYFDISRMLFYFIR